MKKYFYLLFIILIPYNCFSQARTNKKLPQFSTLSVLRHTLGCIYNSDTGQWYEKENYILGFDEFSTYEFFNVSYNGNDYLLLIKYYTDGYWEYPKARIGFSSYENSSLYLFDKDEFLSQWDNNSSNNIIRCKLYTNTYGSLPATIRYEHIPEKMYEIINAKTTADSYKNIIIQYNNNKTAGTSRFLIYTESCRDYGYEYRNKKGKLSSYEKSLAKRPPSCDFNGFTRPIYSSHKLYTYLGTDEIFKYAYYECSYDDFNDFINAVRGDYPTNKSPNRDREEENNTITRTGEKDIKKNTGSADKPLSKFDRLRELEKRLNNKEITEKEYETERDKIFKN